MINNTSRANVATWLGVVGSLLLHYYIYTAESALNNFLPSVISIKCSVRRSTVLDKGLATDMKYGTQGLVRYHSYLP